MMLLQPDAISVVFVGLGAGSKWVFSLVCWVGLVEYLQLCSDRLEELDWKRAQMFGKHIVFVVMLRRRGRDDFGDLALV